MSNWMEFNRLPYWILFSGICLFVFLCLLDSRVIFGKARSIFLINGVDPVYYYSVTHSLLFDRDFNLSNQLQVLVPADPVLTIESTLHPANPFPLGLSLLQIPFLAIGHSLAKVWYGESNGYNRICYSFYYLGNITFLCIGLASLYGFLQKTKDIFTRNIVNHSLENLLIVLILVPSTPLLYYSVTPPMSHVSSFMCTCLFLHQWIRIHNNSTLLQWIILGCIAGLMILCRWQTSLFVLYPFLFDFIVYFNRQKWNFGQSAKNYVVSRSLFVFFALSVAGLQLIEWKSVYGSFLLIPQGDGFFNSYPERLLHVLFSTQNGWFLWTPISILGIAGLVYLCFYCVEIALPGLVCILLQVLLIGSLRYTWFGAYSFGARQLIECTPFLAVGLQFILLQTDSTWRKITFTAILLCTLVTSILLIQFLA